MAQTARPVAVSDSSRIIELTPTAIVATADHPPAAGIRFVAYQSSGPAYAPT